MKSISVDIRNYFEKLAELHESIHHQVGECHFACSLDEADNRYARVMCYPCLVLDCGDIQVMGSSSQKLLERNYTLFFLDHVRDSADSSAVNKAFDTTEAIALDFLARLERNKADVLEYPFLNRLDISNTTLNRIEHEKNQLYGYAVTVVARSMFHEHDCNSVWRDVQ